MTQVQVVSRAGLSQAQLSRVERGASLPTEADADELGRLYGLDEGRRAELVQAASDARAGIRDTRLVIQRGATLAMQRRWRQIEGESRVVRAYQPALVLGVLQTAAYASVVLGQPEASVVVRDRMLRHRRLLDEPPPRHVLIHTEGALRYTVGSAEVMAGQIEALIEASRREHVLIGIIPADVAVHRVTSNAFHLYDDRAAAVGLEVAAATLTDVADVEHFAVLFAELEGRAVFGDLAREVLTRVARDHRARSGTRGPHDDETRPDRTIGRP